MKIFIALMLSGTVAMASDVSGIVLLPNGLPAAGAQVALVTSNSILYLHRAELRPAIGADLSVTEQDGHFSLHTTNDATTIIALNGFGYVQVALKDFMGSSNVTLQPWGRVEGVLRVGSEFGTNQQMILQTDFKPGTRLFLELDSFQDRTDRSGKFAFECVPPGTWRVSHSSEWFGDLVAVKAGETTHIIIGGTGRPLVAKFLIPESVAKLRQGPIPPSGTILEFFEPDSSERPSYLVMAELYGSDHREHHAQMAADGIIRVDDVTPGKWWLVADLLKIPREGGSDTTYATFGQEVIIPEIPGGRSDEPLDLGDLKPIVVHTPQPGEDAPPLEVQTAKGGTFNLADHRGQYVLLDFEPLFGANQTNTLVEAAWKAYGGNKQFAMLTVQVPPTAGTYAYLIEQNWKSAWPLARLEKLPWYEVKPLRASFGLQCDRAIGDPNLPVFFLIGSDGKFVGSHLKADEISAVIGQFLGKK
jgi:hypothetical protein